VPGREVVAEPRHFPGQIPLYGWLDQPVVAHLIDDAYGLSRQSQLQLELRADQVGTGSTG